MNSDVFDIHRKLKEGAEKIREAERIARRCGDSGGADRMAQPAREAEDLADSYDPKKM